MTQNRERGRASDVLNQSVGSFGSGSNGANSFTANNDNLLAKLKQQEKLKEMNAQDIEKY